MNRDRARALACCCPAALRVDEGLIVCASGHVYALASALPADELEARAGEDAGG